MLVSGHKLVHDERCPYSVRSVIHGRVYRLGVRLQEKLGKDYEVKTINSYYSEAAYVHIYKGGRKVIVGFRNHEGHHRSNADIYFNLSDFKSWSAFEKVFFGRTFYRIVNDLK